MKLCNSDKVKILAHIRESCGTLPILSLDETWANQIHMVNYVWQDFKLMGTASKCRKGKQINHLSVEVARTGFIC